jgi:hypothetical protein
MCIALKASKYGIGRRQPNKDSTVLGRTVDIWYLRSSGTGFYEKNEIREKGRSEVRNEVPSL